VLVADSRKFRRQSLVQFAAWDAIGHVVTDDGTPSDVRAWLTESVRDVRFVIPEEASRERV